MELMNLSCEGFLEELASKAAAPGGGGASALMIGAGMVPRGEMALITAQIGFNEHVLGSEYYSTIIFIISLVTLVAPLLLKLTIRKVPGVGAGAAGTAGAEQ